MTLKAFIGAACAAFLWAAGPAHSQNSGGKTGSATTGGGAMTATSPDSASSGTKGSTGKQGTGSKSSSTDKSGGPVASPSGGIANPKDVTPGTYNQSGGAVPKTTDPMQTKNSRDGNPLPSASSRAADAASANKK